MALNALFDPKRKAAVERALEKDDLGAVFRKLAPSTIQPGQKKCKLSVLDRVPMEEAIIQAQKSGIIMASNKSIDAALQRDEWKSDDCPVSCWTGTMVCYVQPGRSFIEESELYHNRRYIIQKDPNFGFRSVLNKTRVRILFPIPRKYRDKRDSILAVNHGDFTCEVDGKDLIISSENITLIEHFPSSNGRYIADSLFGIPCGPGVEGNTDGLPRILSRTNRWVGLISRINRGMYHRDGGKLIEDVSEEDARLHVNLSLLACSELSIIQESPEELDDSPSNLHQ